jgi:hypothetical protein
MVEEARGSVELAAIAFPGSKLKAQGVLTDEEFAAEKAKILGQ